jgi:hypothetical protein
VRSGGGKGKEVQETQRNEERASDRNGKNRRPENKKRKTKEQRTGKEKEWHKRVANDPACTCSLFSSLF